MINGLLIDLSGVLYQGSQVIDGAIEAIERLHAARFPLAYLTNSCRSPRHQIYLKLRKMGFAIDEQQVLTAVQAAVCHIKTQQLRPYLVMHPDVLDDFSNIDQAHPNAVLVGDPGASLDYNNLNQAFRLLMRGAPLLCVATNRYFMEDGQLSLDAGAIVQALAFAADSQPTVLGKPAPAFFKAGLDLLKLPAAKVMMVGDDVENDVLGAAAAGLPACLVRSGKYQKGDEQKLIGDGLCCHRDLLEVIDALLV